MKRMFIVSMVVILCFFGVNTSFGQELKRYAVKSAIVEYQVSGNQTGSETLYFDEFGAKEAKYSEYVMNVFGFKSETKNVTIFDGEWVYSIDLNEQQGTKINIAKAQEMAVKGMQNQSLMDYGEKMLKKMGAVKEGVEEVLGKECQIYAFPDMNMRVWLYKRIPMRSTAKMAGIQMDLIATSIQENVTIPRDKLEVPQGVSITDASEQLGAMRDMLMNGFGE